MFAQEMAALQAIKTIHTGQTQYYSQFEVRHYSGRARPSDYRHLRAQASDLIPEDLALAKSKAIKFTLTPVARRIRHQSHRQCIWNLRQPYLLLRSEHGDPPEFRTGSRHRQQPALQ